MVMWDEVAAEVAKEFPDVKCDKMLVDAMTCRMVLDPKSLDTIVATNLVSRVMLPRVAFQQLTCIACGYPFGPCSRPGWLDWYCTDQ